MSAPTTPVTQSANQVDGSIQDTPQNNLKHLCNLQSILEQSPHTSHDQSDGQSAKKRKHTTMSIHSDEEEINTEAPYSEWETSFNGQSMYGRESFNLFAQTVNLKPHQRLLPLDVELHSYDISRDTTEIGACMLDNTERRWTATFCVSQNGIWHCRYLDVNVTMRPQTRMDASTFLGSLFWGRNTSVDEHNSHNSGPFTFDFLKQMFYNQTFEPRDPTTLRRQHKSAVQLIVEKRCPSMDPSSSVPWRRPTVVASSQIKLCEPLGILDGNQPLIDASKEDRKGKAREPLGTLDGNQPSIDASKENRKGEAREPLGILDGNQPSIDASKENRKGKAREPLGTLDGNQSSTVASEKDRTKKAPKHKCRWSSEERAKLKALCFPKRTGTSATDLATRHMAEFDRSFFSMLKQIRRIWDSEGYDI
ncbi:MAG: hypothetical protein LQ337_000656 [Flavoplaca oasis]|nr:MAG: hypothetical protein LQ337_000656 [Flavoplaca oasis]